MPTEFDRRGQPARGKVSEAFRVILGGLVAAGLITGLIVGLANFPVNRVVLEDAPTPGYTIKGNISVETGAKLYHVPGMRDYDITVIDPSKGERWFRTEAEAIEAGWRRAGPPQSTPRIRRIR